MSRKKSSRSSRKEESRGAGALTFSRVNAMLAAAGVVSIVVGYVLLSGGSVTAAPLLLVLGYVVLLPLAIIL